MLQPSPASTRCTYCKEAGLKSLVSHVTSIHTALEPVVFDDGSGKLHSHDSNITVHRYRCSNQHTFEIRTKKRECWCGWPSSAIVAETPPSPEVAAFEVALKEAVTELKEMKEALETTEEEPVAMATDNEVELESPNFPMPVLVPQDTEYRRKHRR